MGRASSAFIEPCPSGLKYARKVNGDSMRAARSDLDPESFETTLPVSAQGSLAAATAVPEREPQASLLGSLGDLAPTKPVYVPKQPNDMRRVGLDALEADGEL